MIVVGRYNVYGTLADQLTYPETASTTEIGKDAALLKDIFQQVDLEYLLERPNALTEPMAWSNILSLGEKQRMQIARLIYHKPRYAILVSYRLPTLSRWASRVMTSCIFPTVTDKRLVVCVFICANRMSAAVRYRRRWSSAFTASSMK